MSVAVRFPGLHTATLPGATVTVPVVVDQDGAVVGARLLTRAQARQTFANLPVGNLTVYAAAVGSDSQVLALGKATTTLHAGLLAQAQVEMLPLLVFSGEERLAIMASLRKGFPLAFGLSLRPLPPGSEIKPGTRPTPRPTNAPIQLNTLSAQPAQVPVGYPVVLSIAVEQVVGDLAAWEFQWQGGSPDATLTTGRISPTTVRGNRAESVWTPDAAGRFVFRVTVTDGQTSVTSNDVGVTVTRDTGGANVGGNF
ncbi:MAG: hypothetical protein H7338_10195 [Candidatus Sericytochromatia bacterium]|nr:hypothetical protein [Candidatus Sericytochromatia bacterium]